MLGINAPLGPRFAAPPTSYANPGGTGDRRGMVTVTCSPNISAMIYGGALENLVDGGFDADSTRSVDFFAADFVDGDWFTFDFGAGASRYVDEIRTWFDRTVSWGTWTVRGSDDATNWTTLGDFAWTGIDGATSHAVTGMPPRGFRYLGLRKAEAASGTVPFFREVEFRIAR